MDLDALAQLFPAWDFGLTPFGCRAQWTSENGKHVRYVAGSTATDLRGRLERFLLNRF